MFDRIFIEAPFFFKGTQLQQPAPSPATMTWAKSRPLWSCWTQPFGMATPKPWLFPGTTKDLDDFGPPKNGKTLPPPLRFHRLTIRVIPGNSFLHPTSHDLKVALLISWQQCRWCDPRNLPWIPWIRESVPSKVKRLVKIWVEVGYTRWGPPDNKRHDCKTTWKEP